jgi:uncharacterized protein
VKEREFEWDDAKAASNKHGVSFLEAATVFHDDDALISDDLDHATGEDRFIIIGISKYDRLLLVSYTYRYEETVRLISARRTSTAETRTYRLRNHRRR